jgi:hypothetical protein
VVAEVASAESAGGVVFLAGMVFGSTRTHARTKRGKL